MRHFSYNGYLKYLLKKYSKADTISIFKLTHECENGNIKLKEPLYLYAVENKKTDILFRAVKSSELKKEFFKNSKSSNLPASYKKIFETYKSIYCTSAVENEQKSQLRSRIISWQKSKGLSNYRIYTSLHLNPGNVNSWLKHGDSSKISLSTAIRILNYVQKFGETKKRNS